MMVATILDAAARVLIKDGYEAFSTNRVAEKAGVSVGSLYQYFPNKESLIAQLMERHVQELERGIDAITEAAEGLSLTQIVYALIEENVRAHLVDPELHRVLSDVPEMGKNEPKDAFAVKAKARVRATLEAHRKEIVVKDLDLATYILAKLVEASVHDAVSERPDELRSGTLALELTRMIITYLTGKPAQVPSRLRVAAE